MKITTNYSYPKLSNKFQVLQDSKNVKNCQTSFQGLKAKNLIVSSSIALAALGFCSCKNNPQSNTQAYDDFYNAVENSYQYEYDRTVDRNNDSKTVDVKSMKDTTDYNPVIDKFMEEDNAIVKIERSETFDSKFVNAFRIFCGLGYNKNGEIIRKITIYADEPSPSCSEPTYGPQDIEKTYYYSDKTVVEYCANTPEQEVSVTKIEYKKKSSLDGKSGYKKTETIYAEPVEGIKKVVTYEKGESYITDGIPMTDNKFYHKQVISYDENNNEVYRYEYKPNQYGEIKYSEK